MLSIPDGKCYNVPPEIIIQPSETMVEKGVAQSTHIYKS
jgi:hypothetical protein